MRSQRASNARSLGRWTNLGYGLVVGFLVVTLAVATQKTFFGGPPRSSEAAVGSSTAAGRPSSRSPMASRTFSDGSVASLGEDEAAVEPVSDTMRVPAQRQRSSVTPDPSLGNNPVASHPPTRGWLNPLPGVASLFSFGGGGDAATPGTVATSPTASSPATSSATGGPQVREVFFGTSEAAACQPGPREFLLAALDDLYVCVIWSGLTGSYAEELTFLTQDGHLYQNLPVVFVTAGATPPADGIEVRGRLFPVSPAGWGANGETLVVARLPVGGTFISRYSMVGLWTVKVALDGQVLAQDNFDLLAQ